MKSKTSLCKSLFRVFKILSDDFNKNCKLIVDFKQSVVFKNDVSDKFSLEVIHPVFLNNLTSQLSSSGTSLRKVRS